LALCMVTGSSRGSHGHWRLHIIEKGTSRIRCFIRWLVPMPLIDLAERPCNTASCILMPLHLTFLTRKESSLVTPCYNDLHKPEKKHSNRTHLLLPGLLLRWPREHWDCFYMIKSSTYRLLVVLPSHPGGGIYKLTLPKRIGASSRLWH